MFKRKKDILKKKFLGLFLDCPISMKMRCALLRGMGYHIGEGSLIGKNFYVSDRGIDQNNLIIGKRVNIASSVTIVTTSWPNTSRLSKIYKLRYGQVIIEDDVWIGTGAIILPGIKIGQCSIIGAGSVVNTDIPPYSLVQTKENTIIKMNEYLVEKLKRD